VATAYASAPLSTGTYTWNVTAIDGAGQPLATSATRKFSVDATPPAVKKVTPAELKAKSTIKVTFTERVKGISKKSVKLFKEKATSKGTKLVRVDAKITSLKKGKVASVDPKGRLKPGRYHVALNTKKIKDLRGNRLVASDVAPSLRVQAPVRGDRSPAPMAERRLPGSATIP
jgi:hypothetical protein